MKPRLSLFLFLTPLIPPLFIILTLCYLGLTSHQAPGDYIYAAEVLKNQGGIDFYLKTRNLSYLFYLVYTVVGCLLIKNKSISNISLKKFLGVIFLGLVLTTFAYFLAAITIDLFTLPNRISHN